MDDASESGEGHIVVGPLISLKELASIISNHQSGQENACQNDSGKSANPVTARDTTAQPESATSAMVEDTSAHHFQKERLSPGTSASDAKEAGTCHPVQGTSESRSVEPNQSLPPAQDAEGQGATINISHVTDHSWNQLLSQGVCEKEQEENGRRFGAFEWINIPHTFEGVDLKAISLKEFASIISNYQSDQLFDIPQSSTASDHPCHNVKFSTEPNQSLPPAPAAAEQGATIDIPHVTDHSWSQLLSQGVCEKEQDENGRRVGPFEWINIPHTFEGVGLKASMDNPYRTIPLHTDQPKGTNVNHPDHYNAGGIECIDAMEAAATPEEFRGFCKLNALKYLWRERGKNGNEDLEKAVWYLNRAIESSKREKAV